MKHFLSIDRFEGTLAVLLTEDGEQINVPKAMLPKGSKAGDVLTLTLERDEASTRHVADKTAQIQAELRKTDQGREARISRRVLRLTVLLCWISIPAGAQPVPAQKGLAIEPGRGANERLPGRLFLATMYGQDKAGGGVVTLDPNDETWKVLTTQKPHLHAVRVSPDGRFLALSPLAQNRELLGLWLYKTSGDPQPRQISERGGELCWSPDGKSILVTRFTDQFKPTFWRVSVDGSGEDQLPIPSTDLIYDCSPRGNWLLTLRLAQAEMPFYLIRPDGTGERLLLASTVHLAGFKGSQVGFARFSPDGRKVLTIAALREGQPPQTKKTCLLSLDVDGGQPQILYEREAFKHSAQSVACWSPDGKSIGVRVLDGDPPQQNKRTKTHLDILSAEGAMLKSIAWPEPLEGCTPFDWR